jgi:hypothetical protein
MALPNDISKIGQIANAVYNSVTANATAITALSINNNSVYPSTGGFRRNRIINGAMQVDQRNSGAAQTLTNSVNTYTVDRWQVTPVGNNITGQRVVGPAGYNYTYQMTGATSVTNIYFLQKIEGENTADLVNQNVTISLTISNSLLTTVNWNVSYANAPDNFASITSIASGTFTVSSTATQYTATFNAGANAANGLYLQFYVGAQTSGTWKMTGVQLEAGSLATPFERQIYSDTLAQCQRYYGIVGMTLTSSTAYEYWNTAFWKASMRTAPTLSVFAGSLSGATIGVLALTQLDGIRQITRSSVAVDVSIAGSAEL